MLPVPRRAKGQPNRLRTGHVPAPIGGLNTLNAGVSIPETDAIYCYNMIGAEFGLRTRLGWAEWCAGLDGEVRSLLPYYGSSSGSNRLFACTQTGIWDVSSSGDLSGHGIAPTQVATFPTQNADSGWGIATAFHALGGYYLIYTDEANGYWLYTEGTNSWAQVAQGVAAGQINGVDPATFCFVLAWKNRLWFVQRGTGMGWYLPIGQFAGTAVQFNFGNRFKYGGDLRGLYSFTYDGGNGLDDALVAVSGGGDILIYQGTDPSQASTFGMQGVWYLGAVPAYRRLGTDYGGDLLFMSSTGIMPLSKLITGNIIYDRSQYQTAKVANLFNQLQSATSTQRGWMMRLHPSDAALIVNVPVAPGQPSQQLVMSLITKGWHQYRGLPMGLCAEPWNGQLYFGTPDGRVCTNSGYVDGITLASPLSGFTPIEWSLMTAYGNAGTTQLKRMQSIKVKVMSQGGAVVMNAAAKFNWDMTELQALSGSAVASGATWDNALWDQAVWAGQYQAQAQVFGSTGYGPDVAIAIRGLSSSRMTLTGIDLAYDLGGIL